MKHIWSKVEKSGISPAVKRFIFLAIMIVITAAIGGIIWGTIGQWLLPEILWLFVFMGYPAVLAGLFGGICYLWNHEFS